MKKPVFNPILPSWEYVPDVEPRVFGDRLYLYGSHDRFGGDSFCMNDYVGWSAPLNDLSDWRCEGIIYSTKADPANADGGQKGVHQQREDGHIADQENCYRRDGG